MQNCNMRRINRNNSYCTNTNKRNNMCIIIACMRCVVKKRNVLNVRRVIGIVQIGTMCIIQKQFRKIAGTLQVEQHKQNHRNNRHNASITKILLYLFLILKLFIFNFSLKITFWNIHTNFFILYVFVYFDLVHFLWNEKYFFSN